MDKSTNRGWLATIVSRALGKELIMGNLKKLIAVAISIGIGIPVVAEAQWSQIKEFPKDAGTVSSFASGGADLFAATSQGVLSSPDKGATWHWTRMKGTAIESMVLHDGNLFVVTDQGLLHSMDNGKTWAMLLKNPKLTETEIKQLNTMREIMKKRNPKITIAQPRSILSVAVEGKSIYAGTNGNYMFVSRDQGKTWIQNRTYYNVSVSHTPFGLLVDLGNDFALTTDGGKTWIDANFDHGTIFSIVSYGSNVLFGTENGIEMFTFSNNRFSQTYTRTQPRGGRVSSLAVIATNVYAATDSGVFRSTDGGINWTGISSGLSGRDVTALGSNGDKLFAATDQGVFSRSIINIRNSLIDSWGRFAPSPAHEALEKAEPLTEFKADVLYAAMSGSLSPDNPVLAKYFPQYASAKNEFERHRLIGAITDSLRRYYGSLQKVHYFYARCDGQLGEYSFRDHAFSFANGVFQTKFGQLDVLYYHFNIGGGMFASPMGNLPVSEASAQSFVERYPDRHVVAFIVCKPSGTFGGGYIEPQLRMNGIYFIITTADGQILGIYKGDDAPR